MDLRFSKDNPSHRYRRPAGASGPRDRDSRRPLSLERQESRLTDHAACRRRRVFPTDHRRLDRCGVGNPARPWKTSRFPSGRPGVGRLTLAPRSEPAFSGSPTQKCGIRATARSTESWRAGRARDAGAAAVPALGPVSPIVASDTSNSANVQQPLPPILSTPRLYPRAERRRSMLWRSDKLTHRCSDKLRDGLTARSAMSRLPGVLVVPCQRGWGCY